MTLQLYRVSRMDRKGDLDRAMQIVAATLERAIALWRQTRRNTFSTLLVEDITPERVEGGSPDHFMNYEAREGCDRCTCGSKYWEDDRCVYCKTPITELIGDPCWYADNREETS